MAPSSSPRSVHGWLSPSFSVPAPGGSPLAQVALWCHLPWTSLPPLMSPQLYDFDSTFEIKKIINICFWFISPQADKHHRTGHWALSQPCPQIWRVISEHFLKESARQGHLFCRDYMAPPTLCPKRAAPPIVPGSPPFHIAIAVSTATI